jgi:hypothetical protein
VLAIAIPEAAMAMAAARAASTDGELADHQYAAEKDKRDQDDAEERGGRSPQEVQEFRTQGACGGDNDAGIQNIVDNIIQCQDFPLTC